MLGNVKYVWVYNNPSSKLVLTFITKIYVDAMNWEHLIETGSR